MNLLEEVIQTRPRVLNGLHLLHLARPLSQTNERELSALARHAAGKHKTLEIGTYQGVSAARIASSLSPTGLLYCVDPWPAANGRVNPCWRICERHVRRTGVFDRIRILRGLSREVYHLIPENLDFAFIDGDHSWTGIHTDWHIVSSRLAAGGIVCVHDAVVPLSEPWRQFDSVRFFEEVIVKDDAFTLLETLHSLAVLRKL